MGILLTNGKQVTILGVFYGGQDLEAVLQIELVD